MSPAHGIETDGVTVWINGPDGLLARFGRNGIDIHNPLSVQQDSGRECLFCTHTPTDHQDWELFVLKMAELHGITVGPELMPDRCR
jgi:hypothetical protein